MAWAPPACNKAGSISWRVWVWADGLVEFGIEKIFASDPLKSLESMTYVGVIYFESG
jgi:hypothetical protein